LTINAHERLAIAHLHKTGPMTMSELGSRIPLSRAAITALTDRLEALSYVVRTPDTHDRRRTVLSLTARPSELMHDLTVPFSDEVEGFEAGFDEVELDAVRRYTTGLAEMAERHATQLRQRAEEELPSPN
jgi:DNA-binding MarR family transcriptional regulator